MHNGGTKIQYKSIDNTPLVGIINIPPKTNGFVLMMHGITVDKDEWENFYVERDFLFSSG